jgi:hypothetical protein
VDGFERANPPRGAAPDIGREVCRQWLRDADDYADLLHDGAASRPLALLDSASPPPRPALICRQIHLKPQVLLAS